MISLSSRLSSSFCLPLSSLRIVPHYPFTLFPFVLSPILLWPNNYIIPSIIFSSCLPSSLHLDCPRASCLLVSCSPTSLYLVSDHPFVLSLSSFYFYRFVSRHTLSHPPCIPNSKNSWVQSLEAEQPVLVQGLRPQLLAMHPGPHHFVSHHPFILSPFVLFRAFSRHPCIPNYRELLG